MIKKKQVESRPAPAILSQLMFVNDYKCLTAAGPGPESLMRALYTAKVCSRPARENEWATPIIPGGLISLIPGETPLSQNAGPNIVENVSKLWQNIFSKLPSEVSQSRVGLIFSSTKGNIEDYVSNGANRTDPFIAIVEGFRQKNPQVKFSHAVTMSNACSSSHVALEYIQDLFDADRLDYALLLAADVIGPFIYNGFNSLKVLSHTKNIPFSAERDGLQLGEALTAVFLSRKINKYSISEIQKVASDTEGSSITRPSVNGKGLVRTLQKLKETIPNLKPDLIVAHGTGTKFNDLAEDQALSEFLTEINSLNTPITGVKWSVGHTLGASGSVDLIAACEAMKNNNAFSIGTKAVKDPRLTLNYLMGAATALNIRQVLITSLGFGGVHASLSLRKVEQ